MVAHLSGLAIALALLAAAVWLRRKALVEAAGRSGTRSCALSIC